jgi:hypothetical protein
MELTYPPAGAGCRALSTSRPCPGYCMARVGATAMHSRSETIATPAPARSRPAASCLLLLVCAVIKGKCHMLGEVHSLQARVQGPTSDNKVVRWILVTSTVATREENWKLRLCKFLYQHSLICPCSVAVPFVSTQYKTRNSVPLLRINRYNSIPSIYIKHKTRRFLWNKETISSIITKIKTQVCAGSDINALCSRWRLCHETFRSDMLNLKRLINWW